MAFTADLTTDIGKVRQFIWDLDSTKPIFPDDQMIQNFLDAESGDTKQAAAFALETIAGNRVMVLQVIQNLDLKTDGKSVAQGLLATAQRFRDTSNNDWAGLDFAQITDSSEFAYREFLMKQIVKNYT